jgi:2-keto-4-pentenoate hydratase/2-oxohepta-3-ene-1,7-dioic acid hydratase in catechol pathway
MRFATVLHDGRTKTVLDRDGVLVDLAAAADGTFPVGRALVDAWIAHDPGVRAAARRAAESPAGALPTVPPASVRFLPPIPDAGQAFAIGLNYLSHCREQGKDAPAEPMFFNKNVTALAGHGDGIVRWPLTSQLDFEGELAVVIGRGGRAIPEAEALRHVFGYTIMNDVTARDLQRTDRQWARAKGMDTFAPMGPFMVTADRVGDPQALRIRTWVNGEPRQDASTAEMTFPVARLIAHVSGAITLRPGDLISTGTPAGVGVFAKPPRFLVPGDEVRIAIDGIGELVNRVVEPA